MVALNPTIVGYAHNNFLRFENMYNFEMKMIDEVDEPMDLFDQILNGIDYIQTPIYRQDLSPMMMDEPIVNLSSESQESPQETTQKKTFCTCTKSMCKQKYCPCFKDGLKCGP